MSWWTAVRKSRKSWLRSGRAESSFLSDHVYECALKIRFSRNGFGGSRRGSEEAEGRLFRRAAGGPCGERLWRQNQNGNDSAPKAVIWIGAPYRRCVRGACPAPHFEEVASLRPGNPRADNLSNRSVSQKGDGSRFHIKWDRKPPRADFPECVLAHDFQCGQSRSGFARRQQARPGAPE